MVHAPQNIIFIQEIGYIILGVLFLLGIALMVRYWQFKKTSRTSMIVASCDAKVSKPRHLNASLDHEELDEYAKRLDAFLKGTKLYLQPGLSLDILSQETNIPKHRCSQLLNAHLSKSFYHLMAEYRIAYAIKVLNERTNIKMESLAYECGYHSKTSFNKYFKEMIGLTPSEYRNNLAVQV